MVEPIYVMALGAGCAGTVVGMFRGFAPQLGLSDEIILILIGYVGKEKASGSLRDFCTGLLIAGIAMFIEPMVAGIAPAIGA